MGNTLVFTGSYTRPLTLGDGKVVQGGGDGVGIFCLDEKGGLTKRFYIDAPNPTYLALDSKKRTLYAANELAEENGLPASTVSAYRVDARRGELRYINRQPTGGESACHVALSPGDTHLLAANFAGGSVCVFPIGAGGGVERPSCFFRHFGSGADPDRQAGPHPHQLTSDPAGGYLLAPDLGTDELVVYRADWEKGHLLPAREKKIPLPPGMGPRLLVFDQTGARFYLLCELGSAVCVYDYDSREGGAKLRQTISTLPDGCKVPNTAAGIKLHPAGKHLFASNRGDDSIAVYAVEPDGTLTLCGIFSSGGKTPRDFDITPDGAFLIVGNQDSDALVVFSIDGQSGGLREVSRAACGSVTAVLIAEMGEGSA